ncbi:MAG: aromatic amino acid lyase [Flavobacteriaceae bacterium]
MEDTGIHSVYMILQYTTAALASENKSLCFPASADSIPTSLGQEDHVSMGSISGRKALQISDNVLRILSIEVLTAAQALTFRRPLASGVLLDAVYQKIRSEIPFPPKDRIFYHYIEKVTQWVSEGILLNTVKNEATLQGISLKTAFSEQFDQY